MEEENDKEQIQGVKLNSSNQDQIQKLIFSKKIGWQEIIYDLINTEQLDPWDINIITLTDGYLKKVEELEEADFFISGKVLLAAALLLRLKSEILLNKYIKSIDDILFGRTDSDHSTYKLERIELDEDIPELVPRSPMPRFKKVTLSELLESLNKAIVTENRRIKKEILNKNAFRESSISLPRRRISIKDKILDIYDKLFRHLGSEERQKITFSELVGKEREERIASFGPLLHLENQQKVWLHQESHFSEIDIWLKPVYFKNNPDPFAELKDETYELEEFDEAFVEKEEDEQEEKNLSPKNLTNDTKNEDYD
ncbi:hypothetical protein COU57_02775 [Candidatus Pacearchaeota archaeon CG10_big_fil_rev_8_21_14_0_10_32_14]|nr:MAG: hypothetical protein COU57_02775 [Candidatus Pacearchaeota archaeon CG10_big_fil_rev_8_21_14_0_10_32_14]